MDLDLLSDLARIFTAVLLAAWCIGQARSGYAKFMAGADEDTLDVGAWIDVTLGTVFAIVALLAAWGVANNRM